MDSQGSARTATSSLTELEGLQAETLLAFTSIYGSLGSCNHKFALCLGAGPVSCAAALAFTALGGTCLVLDGDAGLLRNAGRMGATDFTVNGLSEALRILKNEVRKGTPVSVGLLGDPERVINEMVHQGVQPDLVCGPQQQAPALERFVVLGSHLLRLPAGPPNGFGRARLVSSKAESMMERRAMDRVLQVEQSGMDQEGLPQLEIVQVKWLSVASRLFRADKARVYWEVEPNG